MGYIGPSPNPGQNREVDDISSGFNGSEVNFTLQVSSQNVSPGSSNAIIVSLGGVVQNPGTDYTVAASTLTFTTAPASGLAFFGLVLGQQVDTSDANFSNPVITGDLSIEDKIVHTGDTNTAIRFPAVDTVTAETAGSERARIDSSGRLLLGTNTSRAAGGNTHKLFQIESTDATSGLSLTRNSATTTSSIISFAKSRGTSNGSNTVIQDDDELGRIKFSGADGTDLLSEAARIQSFVDGTPGSNDMPGRLTFSTTADGAASPTERMRIDSSGRVGIGASSMQYLLDIHGASGNAKLNLQRTNGASNGNAYGSIFFSSSGGNSNASIIAHRESGEDNAYLAFQTSSGGNLAERMRIHSTGVVQVVSEKLTLGTSVTNGGAGDANFVIEFNGQTTNSIKTRDTQAHSQSNHYIFISGSTEVGRIFTSSSSTTFSTSSDYRLKENVVSISDGISRLKTLKPYRFNFKVNTDTTVDGFLAHEVSSIVPEAISGTKDEVDSDNKPVYQGIDQSKLVPLLTAALQEAIAKIETLETKVAALEAA